MRNRSMATRILLTAALAAALAAQVLTAQTLPAGVQKKATMGGITEYAYPNGLRVLLLPDSSSPKVMVNMTYLVGSRHEGYGESGMAHLLEHMNFIRSTHDRDIKKELVDHGALFNGSTNVDRTNYFETFTATDENLKWALGLEAERMVNMRMDKALLDTEMTVVRNEFERGENSPERILEERVVSTAYLWHNYGKSTIGSRADIEKVPIDRLAAFYRTYYQPDNAVLVVAGQFDETKTLKMVADAFGAIPRPARKLNDTYTVEPVQDGERTVELRRVGDSPVVMMAWHAPALSHPDSAALEVMIGILAATGGGGGHAPVTSTGRLYKALVENKKAVNVQMEYDELHDPGYVLASATLSKDQSLDEARKAMIDTIAGMVSEPPSKEEVERSRTRIVQGMEEQIRNSQTVARLLSEEIGAGDWRLFFLNYEQLKAVTAEDVLRVAKTYFKASNRTVGEFIPEAAPDRTMVPEAPAIESSLQNFKTSLDMSAGEAFDPSPANIEKRVQRGQLTSGLHVMLLPKQSRGATVTATLTLQFGDEKSLTGRRAAGDLTGSMLMRGTAKHTRQQLQDEMVKLDARITVAGSVNRATASIQTTEKNLLPAMELAAEILREPSFPESELELVRKQRVAALENSRTEPTSLAALALERGLHPYAKTDIRYMGTLDEQIEEINGVKLEEIRKFHKDFYGASTGQLSVVGQFDAAVVKAEAEKLFGAWKSPVAFQPIGEQWVKVNAANQKIETPDKQNALFAAATTFAMRDTDDDYVAMVMANYMFGGSIAGRAPDRIRNREGLSYGVNSGFTAPTVGNSAMFRLTAICNPMNAPKVEASFKDELAKTLAEGFTEKEVAEAKKAVRDERIVGRSSDPALAQLLARRDEFGRTMKWDEELDAKIEAITAAQINAAFRKHVDAGAVSIVKAGDFAAAGVYRQ